MPLSVMVTASFSASFSALSFAAVVLAAASLLGGCAPNAAMVRHPLAVHLSDRPEGAQTRRVVQWCDADGVCHVAPEVVLDERDIRSVGLDRGEGRMTLQLRLNQRGLDRLAVVAEGSGAGGRLTLVVDQRALQASAVEASRKRGSVVIEGPSVDMERLFQRLTSPDPERPPAP